MFDYNACVVGGKRLRIVDSSVIHELFSPTYNLRPVAPIAEQVTDGRNLLQTALLLHHTNIDVKGNIRAFFRLRLHILYHAIDPILIPPTVWIF